MKKMMMAVAGLAMAVVMTGCGGSPKSVAEKFANAVIQRETDKAMKCIDTTEATPKEIKKGKEGLDELGKTINDNKLEAMAFYEKIDVPSEIVGYTLINGAKYTDEKATVKVQFKKGKDLKSDGMKIKLVKVNSSWKVKDFDMISDLDTDEK